MGAMGDAVSSFPDFLPPQLREPVLVAIPFFLLLILEWPAARKLEHLESGDQPPAGAYVARGSCRRTSGTRGSSQSSVWTCCSTAITASHIGYGWSGHPSGTSLQRVLQLRHRAPPEAEHQRRDRDVAALRVGVQHGVAPLRAPLRAPRRRSGVPAHCRWNRAENRHVEGKAAVRA